MRMGRVRDFTRHDNGVDHGEDVSGGAGRRGHRRMRKPPAPYVSRLTAMRQARGPTT
ncbi:hypothetical protein [Streptomyces sp. SID9727]|uniref:hypothetical protein n=1 Tax=Streptomyces sp. SID9727 TaxID=2706114 RepID=UPI0013CC2759|nr:hypothetical protein [Streptomyces sp. SID9727]NEC67538.1 hypothetical protein [Streptomyces sp. SID9727]